MSKEIVFEDIDKLQEYLSAIVADFCRDEEFAINDHPIDYDSHWWYIRELYMEWFNKEDLDE